jgi:2-dehydro-3-deoxyphosphooctonate aldolase (KDO 8-P synthase)
MKRVKVFKDFFLSNDSEIKFILGPCQIESKQHVFEICDEIEKLSIKLDFKYIFKSSYDKANRSSHKSRRGIGIKKGLDILSQVREKYNCPVISDVHDTSQCSIVKDFLDIIQIPAFLCRQTDIIIEAAKTNLPINIKKGQFLSPWEMKNVVEKVLSTGNNNLLLTERGTMFGYNNLVSDLRSLPIMKKIGYPVVFDATHSTQLPGGKGESSDGQYEFVGMLAKAAVTTGISGLFIETHDNPRSAPSDGPNMVPLKDLGKLIQSIKLYDNLSKSKDLS